MGGWGGGIGNKAQLRPAKAGAGAWPELGNYGNRLVGVVKFPINELQFYLLLEILLFEVKQLLNTFFLSAFGDPYFHGSTPNHLELSILVSQLVGQPACRSIAVSPQISKAFRARQ